MLPRRVAAFAIDFACFALVAAIVCRLVDHASRSTYDEFPPHQAVRAARRFIPVLLAVYGMAFIIVPWKWGASLGKRWLGLKVISDADGTPLTLWAILLRETVWKWLSIALDGAGLIDGVLTSRAFHDRLANSRVVEVGAAPEHDSEPPWPDVPWFAPVAFAAVCGLLYWSMATQGRLYGLLWMGGMHVPHEAGHFVTMMFPHLVTVASGTIGQMVFPSIASVVFARRRWPVQLAGALAWFAFSMFHSAEYAADAWSRELPLPIAIGDEFSEAHLDSHDWWNMLSAGGILRYGGVIGFLIESIAWLSLAGGLGLLTWLATKKRNFKPRN